MINFLEGFHHREARRITGMKERRKEIGEWECPMVAEVMDTTGLWTIKGYIQRMQDTVAAKIYLQTIYELYSEAESIPGTIRFMQWWEQAVGREVE